MTEKPETSVLSAIASLKANSLTQVVQREIERMILSGEIATGARLNENALATKLSISRGPIREACRALAELGFVHFIPNRGVFVKSLGRPDVTEVYDIRAGLTGLAGMLLAPVVKRSHLVTIDAMLADMKVAADAADYVGFMKINNSFHQFIVDATGNSRLIRMHQGLLKEFQLFRRHELIAKDVLVDALREHHAIVGALKAGDGKACYDASYRHVQNGKGRILAALDRMAADGTPAPVVAVQPR